MAYGKASHLLLKINTVARHRIHTKYNIQVARSETNQNYELLLNL